MCGCQEARPHDTNKFLVPADKKGKGYIALTAAGDPSGRYGSLLIVATYIPFFDGSSKIYANIDNLHIAYADFDNLVVRLQGDVVNILFVVTRGMFRIGNHGAARLKILKHWVELRVLLQKHSKGTTGTVLMADANWDLHSDECHDYEHPLPFCEFLTDTSVQITDLENCVSTYDAGDFVEHQIDYLGLLVL